MLKSYFNDSTTAAGYLRLRLTNGPCHLGHLRTYVPADCYVRYMRRTGEEVVFVSGSDDPRDTYRRIGRRAGNLARALSERFRLPLSGDV